MSPRLLELFDLVFRWTHVIAGIMWIGNSLLFNWLDRNLRPSSRGGEGMYGEIWLLHSGGFYFVEKTALAGQPLPVPLHWFKWQAYTTWLTGAALLLVVYYVGGRALLVDPARTALSPGVAVAVAVGSIVVGGATYDLLWKRVAPRSATAAGVLSIVALVAIVVALTTLLSGRAAFLHVGALLATIMAGNVAHVIMPSQRELVAAVGAGKKPDPAIAARAKTRSIHNNYLTFPVIALMLSSHFPGLYGQRGSWLTLLVLIAAGAAVRHVLNVRYTFRRWVPTLAGTIAATLVALWLLARPTASSQPVSAATAARTHPVSFAEVRPIIDRRCAACHSQSPSITDFGPTPAGVSFDLPETMHALAPRIRVRAVDTRTRPPANRTRITDEERAVLGMWVDQGAPTR
jgi:uncharacterized membrane protein